MRKGDYTGTYSGIHFYPLDPRPEEVELEDIAHALSNICRFNGHVNDFYSVGTHSLNVCALLIVRGENRLVQLYGLLHDAAEAYCCDIPRPLKPYLEGYKEIETGIMEAIYKRFNLTPPDERTVKVIKEADNFALALEGKKLMHNIGEWKLVEADGDLFQLTSTKYDFLRMALHLFHTTGEKP